VFLVSFSLGLWIFSPAMRDLLELRCSRFSFDKGFLKKLFEALQHLRFTGSFLRLCLTDNAIHLLSA
jgi:hypothetical protein